jgi:hypothetical protein
MPGVGVVKSGIKGVCEGIIGGVFVGCGDFEGIGSVGDTRVLQAAVLTWIRMLDRIMRVRNRDLFSGLPPE